MFLFERVFGHAFVINLESRSDRLQQFRTDMRAAGIDESKITRFDAIATPKKGWIGCVQSHIALLERAKAEQWPRITVFEDDFVWRYDHDKNVAQTTFNILERLESAVCRDWNVFMLSTFARSQNKTAVSWLMRLSHGSTSAGYIVNANYYDVILENLRESERLLLQHVHTLEDYQKNPQYALDQHWRTIQENGNWFTTLPPIGKQSDGFSDIVECEARHDY